MAFAHGSILSRAGNVIAKLNNISSPSLKMDKIDITTHQSIGGFKEVEGGLIDPGDINIDGVFDATDTNGQIGLLSDMTSRTLQSFAINFPATTGTSWSFNALVTEFNIDNAAVDGKIGFKATLSISGQPNLGITLSAGLTTPFMALSGAGTLIPAASATVYEYVYSVATGISSITVTPTAAAGVITVNGNTVVSGQASSAIALGGAGSVTTITISVKENGKSPKIYTVKVARA